eukprot:gene11678-34400_t
MDALLTNESVTSVDLSQNHIDDDGAAAIAIALLSLTGAPQLISLDLWGNPFTENGLNILEGAIAIALLSLTGAPQLISLDLRGNSLTENGLNILEGAIAIALLSLTGAQQLISLDLRGNSFTENGLNILEGAIAIALLSMTGAPQLISLDLRGNPFTENGLNILEGVQKVRKHLVLKTGAYTEEEEESKEDAKAKDAGKGPMFKKYFQSGNEEMEREVAEADEKKQITDVNAIWDQPGNDELERGVAEADEKKQVNDVNAIWDQVASCVHRNHIPALMLHLHHLASMMQQEAEPEASGDDSDAPTPSGRRPIASACLSRGLPTIGKILDMVPRQITLQHATVPHNTLGSHRLWACDILSRLLAIGDEEIDKRLLHSKLLPRLLLLALQHPLSSGLHARAVKVLQCCLESKQCAQLLIPMLAEAGWGLELKEDDGTLAKSLTEQLAGWGMELKEADGSLAISLTEQLVDLREWKGWLVDADADAGRGRRRLAGGWSRKRLTAHWRYQWPSSW